MFELNGGRILSLRGAAAPNAGVKGVNGVLGVEIYRPLHLGHRMGSSDVEITGRLPTVLPALRGW